MPVIRRQITDPHANLRPPSADLQSATLDSPPIEGQTFAQRLRSRLARLASMFNLLPQDPLFFDLFEGMGRLAIASAQHLKELTQHFPNINDDVSRIRQAEHDADQLAHKALERLDRTFITPFDREDIHQLVIELDDIIDNIDALAKRFTLYHVTRMEPLFVKQCDVLVEATTVLSDAVGQLRTTHKLADLNPRLIEVHRLESIGDDNHHAAISDLYGGSHDPLHVMKWKEIYDYVENALDGCEDATHVIERIVLKNG